MGWVEWEQAGINGSGKTQARLARYGLMPQDIVDAARQTIKRK